MVRDDNWNAAFVLIQEAVINAMFLLGLTGSRRNASPLRLAGDGKQISPKAILWVKSHPHCSPGVVFNDLRRWSAPFLCSPPA